MQGLKRRVVYITLYEGIAIVAASAGLALMLFTPWYGGSELLERFPHPEMPYRAEQAGQDDWFRTRSACEATA